MAEDKDKIATEKGPKSVPAEIERRDKESGPRPAPKPNKSEPKRESNAG